MRVHDGFDEGDEGFRIIGLKYPADASRPKPGIDDPDLDFVV